MKSLILFSLLALLARASAALRYLLIGCKDELQVQEFISTYITTRKYETSEDNGLYLVDIKHSQSSCGKPVQIISMHPNKSKEDAMSSLIHYISFGAIDGVLTAVDDEDERLDLVRDLHLTTVPHRQPTSLVTLFRQSGNHKYMHYGDSWTFLGDLDAKLPQANMLFQASQKVRVMDTFWVYQRAYIETRSFSRVSATLKAHEGYTVSLFNCLVGNHLPLQLLASAVKQKDHMIAAYLIDEIPDVHLNVLTNLLKMKIEDVDFEVGSPLHQLKMGYDQLCNCSRYTGYHESFEKIVTIRVQAIEEEENFITKKSQIESCISKLEELEAATKTEIEETGEANNQKAQWIACCKLDEVSAMINQYQKELEQYEAKHQVIMQDYKLQVDEAYFL